MANTTAVYARIDTELKNNAENILAKLGITPSSAIQMLDLRLPTAKPIAIGSLTRDEIDAELSKGVKSLKEGKGLTADEVDTILAKEFGI